MKPAYITRCYQIVSSSIKSQKKVGFIQPHHGFS